MDDMLLCPICNTRLRTINLKNKYIAFLNKTSIFHERTCVGPNHSLLFFSDKKTNKIDFFKLSLDSYYSKFLEINYIKQTSEIICFKQSQQQVIKIFKILEMDFPKLIELKEKISLYVAIS